MAPPRRVTARAAIVAAVIGALLLSAALPLREYLNQRGEITTLQQDQAAARARLAELEAERERLNDPAYIAAEARRRLQFVLPGETAYQLILPSPGPSAADGRGTGSGPNAPWYSQVWGSVREADRPAPAPSP